jgi:WD40 repeat protein
VAIIVLGAGGRELYLSSVAAAESRSRELASRARNVWNYDPELAIRLALEGIKVNQKNALKVLKESNGNDQQASGGDDRLDTKGIWPSASLPEKSLGGAPFAIALSPKGNRLAVLASVESSQPAGSSAITLWDVTKRKPSLVTGPVFLDGSTSLAFSPDGEFLAVGSKTSIDLRAASTNLPVKKYLRSLPDSDTRRVVFSPDGQWLATAQDDNLIRLWDYSHKPQAVQAGEVNAFAVVDGGKRIIIVRGVRKPPLEAWAIDLKDGRWLPPFLLPLPTCARPQSVSEGAAYFSATWKAHSCTYLSSPATPEITTTDDDDHLVLDIIWSPGGMAYVELSSSMDFAVGIVDRGKRLEKPIIGARLTTTDGDKSSFMSVDEHGTRFALIDRHVKRLVRVYTLDVPREEELSLPQADRASIEKFAKWLDPRPLTPQECVEYQVKYDLGCR